MEMERRKKLWLENVFTCDVTQRDRCHTERPLRWRQAAGDWAQPVSATRYLLRLGYLVPFLPLRHVTDLTTALNLGFFIYKIKEKDWNVPSSSHSPWFPPLLRYVAL